MIQHEDDALPSIYIAKKLSSYQPTSFSLDDLKLIEKGSFEMNKSTSKNYILPKPVVSSTNSTNATTTKEQSYPFISKYGYLFSSKKKENSPVKRMEYTLPNVMKIRSEIKNSKPILVVSMTKE